MIQGMATRTSRLEQGRAIGKQIRVSVGSEIRLARTGAGASLRDAGRRVGMSHSQFGRIERDALENVSIDQLSRACAAVGLKLVGRAIPGAGPAIDESQLALLKRFHVLLPDGTPMPTEVPLPIPGDLRAWDAMITLDGERIAIEAETRLTDIQALDRRCQLKLRDGLVDRLILLVNDTAHNRAMLHAHREALRATFPLDGRQIIPALRAGRTPEANGIVVL
jgi:transcriptional regulator with XRE-family HTH domain